MSFVFKRFDGWAERPFADIVSDLLMSSEHLRVDGVRLRKGRARRETIQRTQRSTSYDGLDALAAAERPTRSAECGSKRQR